MGRCHLLNLEEAGGFFGSSVTARGSVGSCLSCFQHQPLVPVCIRKPTPADLCRAQAPPAPPAPRPLTSARPARSDPWSCSGNPPPAAFSLKTLRLIFSREFREKLLWFLCIVYFSVTCWTFSRDSSPALRVNIYSLLFEAKDKSPTTLCTASPTGLKVMEIFSAIHRHQQWKL